MFHRYVSATPPCSGRAQRGTANLQVALLDRFDASFDYGIYNCRALTTNASVPSIHSDGRAGDLGFPDGVTGERSPVFTPHSQGYAAVEILRANAWNLGLMGIIWDRRRWSFRTPWGSRYDGPNPHINHIHWEQIPSYAEDLSLDDAYRLIGDPPVSLTKQEIEALQKVAPYATFISEFAKEMMKPGPTTGHMATPQSLMHVLEVHRLVAEDAGVSGLDHLAIKTHLLGQ